MLESARIKAYRLADNRIAELGGWDERLLALEIASIVDLNGVSIELVSWSTGEIDKIIDISVAAWSDVTPVFSSSWS